MSAHVSSKKHLLEVAKREKRARKARRKQERKVAATVHLTSDG